MPFSKLSNNPRRATAKPRQETDVISIVLRGNIRVVVIHHEAILFIQLSKLNSLQNLKTLPYRRTQNSIRPNRATSMNTK
jgi:hypothetical protein